MKNLTSEMPEFVHDYAAAPLLSREDERHHMRLAKEGNEQSRELLIRSNIRLVLNLAAKCRGRGLDYWDLVSEGTMGLMHAVDKFDLKHETKLCTYATFWIHQRMWRAIQEKGRNIRLPCHVFRDQKAKLQNPEAVKPDQRDGFIRDASPLGDVAGELLVDHYQPSAFEQVDTADHLRHIRAFINRNLEQLSLKERNILRMRFGLNRAKTYTYEEIGALMGVSKTRIQQIEHAAVEKLRAMMRKEQAA